MKMRIILFPLVAGAFCLPLQGAIVASPLVAAEAPAFGGFPGSNAVNGNAAEYASNGQGANTFLEFFFNTPATFDTIVVVNRDSPDPSDWISNYTLTYADSTTSSIIRTGARGQGGFDFLGGPITTIAVALDVDTLGGVGGGFNNTGAMEIYFLATPAGMSLIDGVTVAASAPAFGDFSASATVNGQIGRGTVSEYASAGLGAGTFVDFNLGSVQTVGGFDFFDRLAASDQVSSFDMIFSTNDVFGDGDDVTRSYTGNTQSDELS